jgi:hypothetical protein
MNRDIVNQDIRTPLRLALATLAVIVVVAGAPLSALSQQGETLASEKQKGQQEKAQHSEPGRMGTTEPSSQEPTVKPEHAAILVDGRLTVPGAPADSETVPSKFSKRNAALDGLPTMAFPLPLSDEDKQRIRGAASQAPVARADVHPADLLPIGLEVRELPAQVTTAVPATRHFGFVRTSNRVLLVIPSSRIVVGEIAEQTATH